ncbi:hypothetical protein AB1N83_001878 [Pleurotus pulmonarius]
MMATSQRGIASDVNLPPVASELAYQDSKPTIEASWPGPPTLPGLVLQSIHVKSGALLEAIIQKPFESRVERCDITNEERDETKADSALDGLGALRTGDPREISAITVDETKSLECS